jgi:hypothetical protein
MLTFVRFGAIILHMTNLSQILKDIEQVQSRVELDTLYPAVVQLRLKNFAWREIAEFLNERGIDTDHSKVFRMFSRIEQKNAFVVPTKQAYAAALNDLSTKNKLNASALAMLEHHFQAHNRTVTYTQLAQAAHDKEIPDLKIDQQPVSYKTANLVYGKLGRLLGETIDKNFMFAPTNDRGGLFYSSTLGLENPMSPEGSEFQLVMHHELAKAIDSLGWFKV